LCSNEIVTKILLKPLLRRAVAVNHSEKACTFWQTLTNRRAILYRENETEKLIYCHEVGRIRHVQIVQLRKIFTTTVIRLYRKINAIYLLSLLYCLVRMFLKSSNNDNYYDEPKHCRFTGSSCNDFTPSLLTICLRNTIRCLALLML